MLPTKSAMKERMESAECAALQLQSCLADDVARSFLELRAGPIGDRAALQSWLRNLEERAKQAAEGPELSNEKGKVKAGRGRAPVPGCLPPKLYCAALIAEAWKHVHGEYPAPRNGQAAGAAQALWLASGGRPTGTGDNPAAGAWRYHFAKIKDPAVAASRAEIRRHLTLTEQWA
jgi:hypothetical protein